MSKRSQIYEDGWSRRRIEEFQVRRFNRLWERCLADDPFYSRWASQHRLPRGIANLHELAAFPPLTKQELVARSDEVFRGGRVSLAYSTGGSTGEPARFPRAKHDSRGIYANVYVTRSWWGIHPLDRYVHLWGHSHLFNASGLGKLAGLKRSVADWVVNAVRVNAYDISDGAMERYAAVVERSNAKYIVGYTSALCRLARYVASRPLANVISAPHLKCVIATAETMSAEDAELLGRVFGVPVVSEYGAAETGLIAVSRDATFSLQVLWQSVIVRLDSHGEVFVTTLDDRAFPLVNYRLGDRAESLDAVNGNALSLSRVLGRTQDFVTLNATDGQLLTLSAILPVHAIKSDPSITAVQFRQLASGRLAVFVTATKQLHLAELEQNFRERMLLHHPAIASNALAFEQVSRPVLTRAGKQALFV